MQSGDSHRNDRIISLSSNGFHGYATGHSYYASSFVQGTGDLESFFDVLFDILTFSFGTKYVEFS